jgi:hypothetical protein
MGGSHREHMTGERRAHASADFRQRESLSLHHCVM